MQLEQAVRAFEAEFAEVVEFSPSQETAACAPGGNNRYFVVTSGGPKKEGEPAKLFDTADDAIQAWLNAVKTQHQNIPGNVLFWRSRPELMEGRQRTKPTPMRMFGRSFGPVKYYVYSRWTAQQGRMSHAC